MEFAGLKMKSEGPCRTRLLCAASLLLCCAGARCLPAQQVAPQQQPNPQSHPQDAIQPDIGATASVSGVVTDTDGSAVSNAQVSLAEEGSSTSRTTPADEHGVFEFTSVPEGRYIVRINAPGFASWKIKDVLVVHEGEGVVMPTVQLGVEGISTSVNAITVEDLAEEQITTEVHQRILGILPNFYVSYVPDAAPLTRKQKFKLAVHVSADPVTYFTTGVTAGIEQWQGDFAGYGQEFSGYAKRYAATYGDRLSSTFLGAAALPSLLHQDPRYFYRGHGRVITRALYAISTVAVCKGDNGKWQPNYSNVGGNLGAAFVSTLYYPASDQHSVQVTVDKTLLGVAEGAIGTLFQEFLLHHFTHGAPPAQP
jgi:hypothetical protein